MTKNKIAVVGSGRFQGIHHGHALLVNSIINHAKRLGADHYIYPTRTHDSNKNPIPHDEKVGLMRRIFPHANIQSDPEVRGPFEAVKKLASKGYRHVKLVAGQDRIDNYQKSIGSYVKKKTDKDFDPNKHIDLDSFEVISAGDRDPDAEGVEGASGSKMREHVRNNDMASFAKSVPTKSVKVVRDMFNSMKRGMGVKKTLKENFIPIGMTYSRDIMPQIGAAASFIKYLKTNSIDSKKAILNPHDLKSSQMDFNMDKVQSMRDNDDTDPILVSQDGHILDGHHRWLARKMDNKNVNAIVCNVPIIDLYNIATRYTKELNEEIMHKEFGPMLDSFVEFASDKLGIETMPKVRYKNGDDDYNSFAAYNPHKHELSVSTKNRHPMDIFRSVAHELVHHKQKEEDRIGKNVAKEGETGSDIENEANAVAGIIMRNFAKKNPSMFSKSFVVETNTSSMGGIRGLGNVTGEVSPDGTSQYVLDNESQTRIMQGNQLSGLWFDDGIKSYWLDQKGTNEYQKKAVKGLKAVRAQLNEGINDPGKLKAIFLAGGPGSGKDFVMNSALAGEGLREVNSDNAFEYLMKKHGLDMEMPEEEKIERDIVRGRAKNITKEQERLALAGRLGVIINGTADDLEKIKVIKKNLEADGYETMMVFVNTSNEVSRQRNVDRGKGGGRKVPDGTNKQGVPNGSEDIRTEKWELAQKNIGELQKIFGNQNFVVIDNSADIRKVSPEVKEKVLTDFSRVRRMAQQFVRAENQNPAAKAWIERESQKRGITYQEPKRYKTLTQIRQDVPQVVHKPDNELMAQARRLGLSYYGFGRFGRKIGGVNKVLYHSKGGRLVKAQLNEDLRDWFKEKWVRFDTKGNIKGPCAREEGEGKPKCRPLASARAMSKEERAKSARRKRREDPVADRPGKGGKPVNVQTESLAQQAAIAIAKKKSGKYDKDGNRIRKESVQTAIDKINRDRMSEQVLFEKNIPTNPGLWSKAKSLAKSKFDVYPSAYANGWASKWYKSKGGGWKTATNEACWDGYDQKGMKKKGNRMVPNCVPTNEAFENFVNEAKGNKASEREWGTDSLDNLYRGMTPGQKKKPKKKALNQEAMTAPEPWGYNFGGDGIGPTIAVPRAGTPYGFGYGSAYSIGISESIESWMSSEKTQNKFYEKYGNLWEEKLVEAALKLEDAGCGCEHGQKKSIKKLREGMEGGVNNMSMIPTQRKGDQEANEQTEMEVMPRDYVKKFATPTIDPSRKPQYTKARRHKNFIAQNYHPEKLLPAMHEDAQELNERGADSKGYYRSTESGAGLTRKGAKHFGIQTAVTTPPSKLKPGSKAAKRRKSFCARMGGMPGPMKDEKGRPTRKAMSLRRWNCEE